MTRFVLTYGLIGGGLLAVMMLGTIPFLDRIGFDRGAVIGYTTMVLAFLMVYFGVRSYRDTLPGATITFGRAFGVGLLISLVVTLCYVVTWEAIFHLVVPDFVARYTAFALEQARQGGASEVELARKTQELADFATMYQNPLVNVALTALEPLPVALVSTVVSAGLLSRQPGASRGAA